MRTQDFSCRRLGAGSRTITRLRNSYATIAEDTGAITAEYAVVIMAAVAFAGLLVAIMQSGEVRAMLVDLVQSALGTAA